MSNDNLSGMSVGVVIIALACMAFLVFGLSSLLVGMLIDEGAFALRRRYEKWDPSRRQQSKV